jgi:hypothetical protein
MDLHLGRKGECGVNQSICGLIKEKVGSINVFAC